MHELLFLGSVAALYVPLLLSPGPNFIVLTKMATAESRRHAMVAAFGISSASVLYSSLAVTGIGLIVAHSKYLQDTLRLAGGAYLIYKGLCMLKPAVGQAATQETGAVVRSDMLQAYVNGLLTNLTNPQALVFFTSVFATLLSADLHPWAKPAGVALVGACSIATNIATVMLFSLESVQRRYLLARTWIDRTSGLLLGGFGVSLVKAVWR